MMPDTLWTLPGRASLCKLDLCERSESPWETLAKASTKSSSGGAGWRGCPRSLGRERGSPNRENPAVLIKASRAALLKLCSCSPLLPPHRRRGWTPWDSWDGNSSTGKWSDGKRGAEQSWRQTHAESPSLCWGSTARGDFMLSELFWGGGNPLDDEFPVLKIIIHLVLPPRCCPVPVSHWIWEDLQTKRSSICCIFYQVDNAAQTIPSPQPAPSLAMLSRLQGSFQPPVNLILWNQAGKMYKKQWWNNSNKEVRKWSKTKIAPQVQFPSWNNILSGQVQD